MHISLKGVAVVLGCVALATVITLVAICEPAPAIYWDCTGVDPAEWNEAFKTCTGDTVFEFERGTCKRQADELLCKRKVENR